MLSFRVSNFYAKATMESVSSKRNYGNDYVNSQPLMHCFIVVNVFQVSIA